MLALGGRVIEIVPSIRSTRKGGGSVLRLFEEALKSSDDRSHAAFLLDESGSMPAGFDTYVHVDGRGPPPAERINGTLVRLSKAFDYLRAGDVIALSQDRSAIRTLYRKQSHHNHFLVTERCDNYCVMCSQPPRDIDDTWLIDEIAEAIPLLDPGTQELGFTGGEPTLLRHRFLDILRLCKVHLPQTAVHVLSNGRSFANEQFAESWAAVSHPDLVVGIPVYSDLSYEHDFVVQADGAYDETIRGILNLKRLRQRVEVRVVIHRHTYQQLPRLAHFIARNLLFVDHVALMGLELMGFAKANYGDLWIDPVDYQVELTKATKILADAGMQVSIYNHQRCVLDKALWPWAVKSISDWKNDYLPACDGCSEREECGGFFTSTLAKPSRAIAAIRS